MPATRRNKQPGGHSSLVDEEKLLTEPRRGARSARMDLFVFGKDASLTTVASDFETLPLLHALRRAYWARNGLPLP